jgi:hypothetical protein
MSIDYTKLNDRIVEQACESMLLTEQQRQQLFQNKIERATAMIQAREQFDQLKNKEYVTLED